jgi:aminopeptidase N
VVTKKPTRIELKDYRPPEFSVLRTYLDFDLYEDKALVKSVLDLEPLGGPSDLLLNGEGLHCLEVKINGLKLTPADYEIGEDFLKISAFPQDRFQLEIGVQIEPQNNTALEGLYRSNNLFCTQCEPESFRKITYFLDRPDVMSSFQVRIEAETKKYPILLSNGNKKKSGVNGDRHWVLFEDPHPKPCYLFALVAGDLGVLKDYFTTASGRLVALEIYAAHGLQKRCEFAMRSLKKAMAWDEQRFGREYDLDAYRILVVDDFNAGAMENKGLNIFNSRLVLADQASATDDDFYAIESVVAHEYFHNWTGNRVTLRDWFHLSLKEGLTVFRDQEFSADQTSRAEERIISVRTLKERQFIEDAGPNAHPIRPLSCFAVDNFFTPTIYEKGAEVIRMMQTLVGRPGFRKGMDLYFNRHDGHAVIIEDFAQAIAEANNQDWSQFNRWYSQAGTPEVQIFEDLNPTTLQLKVKVSQSLRPMPGQEVEPEALHIPLQIGLLEPQSYAREAAPEFSDSGLNVLQGGSFFKLNSEGQMIFHLREKVQEFVIQLRDARAVLSWNRNFSAPVHLRQTQPDVSLQTLLHYDTDPYNRYEASQQLSQRLFLQLIQKSLKGETLSSPESFYANWKKVLESDLTPGLVAQALKLPEDSILIQELPEIQAPAMFAARSFLQRELGEKLSSSWLQVYESLKKNTSSAGARGLKNLALFYLQFSDEQSTAGEQSLAWQQFINSSNMTDQQGALRALPVALRPQGLELFYESWKKDAVTLNKWFSFQAHQPEAQTFEVVKKLVLHPDFNVRNPNRVYALLRTYGQNLVSFHHPMNRSYEFYCEQISVLDKINPAVATRLASAFDIWKKLPASNQVRVKAALEALIEKGLSKNTYEIISKNLSAN